MTVEEARTALAEAQKNYDAAKGTGVSNVTAASRALSAAKRALATAEKAEAAGVNVSGVSRAEQLSTIRQAQYTASQEEAGRNEKPTVPPADADYTYDYVWRSEAGGRGGYWSLVRYPKAPKAESSGTPVVASNTPVSGTPTISTPVVSNTTTNPNVSYSGFTDSKGKKIYYQTGSFYGGANDIKFIYEDGTTVSFEEYADNPQANSFAQAGWNIGFGAGITPAQQKYKDILGDNPYAPSKIAGGDSYYDFERKIVVVKDSNGTSLYSSDGNLIFGRGSVNSIGMGTVGGLKINIEGSGNYGSPNYKLNPTKGTSTVSNVAAGNLSFGNVTSGDPATLELIKSLQTQIASLTAKTDQAKIDQTAADAAAKKEKAENAISVLTARFAQYNLQSLVPKIKELAIGGATEATITLQLQETPEYKLRFKANEDRIKKGLAVLDPGDYIGIEDKYRQILRAYGLSQFDNDNYVSQFISNDISAAELSSRVQTAVQRVQNADSAVLATLTRFYGIGTNDLVGYILDPEQQFQKIERQVAAAEIGAAAKLQGINAGVSVAEQLAAQGITKAEAQKGYSTIADILPTAEKLSQIYDNTLDSYGLAEAEQEVFNSLASAQRKRRKLIEREVASFSGSSGLGRGSLAQQVGGTF
jgi:hypothetical protein